LASPSLTTLARAHTLTMARKNTLGSSGRDKEKRNKWRRDYYARKQAEEK